MNGLLDQYRRPKPVISYRSRSLTTPDSTKNYVLLSTQFEFPQDYDIQVETDGGEWCAQLKVNKATLSRTTLTIDAIADYKPVRLVVRFAADKSNYMELVRVAKVMLPCIVME